MNKLLKMSDLLIFHRNPPKIALGRDPKVQQVYELYKKQNKVNNRAETLYQKIFPNQNRMYSLVANDFPYNVSPEIVHKVLWLNPLVVPLAFHHNYDLVDLILKQEIPDRIYPSVVYFQNINVNSSIPTIPHFQVFVSSI